MTELRAGLPPLPLRMRSLPIDARGYPVPWFVAWVDGKPEFRAADMQKMARADLFRLCWVCGQPLGKFATFVIGPMCAVNRTTSEPPCHLECAQFSAIACPFLTLPKAKRNERNLPEGYRDPVGHSIPRNPGVTCLWTCTSWRRFRVDDGRLIELGEPTSVAWYAQKRPASREEILESIDSGMPLLESLANEEGGGAPAALREFYVRMMRYLPTPAETID